jgi:hypothetical protein
LIIQLELLFLAWGWSFQVKHYKVLLNNSLILPLHSLYMCTHPSLQYS